MRTSFYVNVLLNRFVNAKYVFSSDVDSYEDGDGQALRDTLNRCDMKFPLRLLRKGFWKHFGVEQNFTRSKGDFRS